MIDPGFSKKGVQPAHPSRVAACVPTRARPAAAGWPADARVRKSVRLFTERSFKTELQEQTYPEILRSNLGNTVLTLCKLGIRDLVHFDFIDPPAPETLMRALELLNYLGALDGQGSLRSGPPDGPISPGPTAVQILIMSPQFGCRKRFSPLWPC